MSANPTSDWRINYNRLIIIATITMVAIILTYMLFYNNLSRVTPVVNKEDSIKFIEVKIDGKTYYLDIKNFTE